ncbi:MAG: DMT family transporter, partial [Thermodesulfobacteriota bacterium]
MSRRFLFLILAVFSVSWAAIFIKLCSAPPLVIAFYRMFIASVLLLPLVFLKHYPALKQLLVEAPKLAILSGIFLGLHFALWVTSLFYTSVSASVVIVATQPVFVAFFSLIFLKEKANWLVWCGIILALIGVAIIGGGDFANLKGDLLALLGAIMAAAYLTLG